MNNQLITLVRHAKSSWKTENQADYDRPLNPRGIQDGPVMARRLTSRHCIPDLLLCSSARRAQETANFLIPEFQLKPEQIEFHEELYLASPDTLLKILSKVSPASNHVMVVAHNPGLEELSEHLAGLSLPPMPTLGVRHFSCQSIRELEADSRRHGSQSESYSDTHKASRPALATLIFDDFPKSDWQ